VKGSGGEASAPMTTDRRGAAELRATAATRRSNARSALLARVGRLARAWRKRAGMTDPSGAVLRALLAFSPIRRERAGARGVAMTRSVDTCSGEPGTVDSVARVRVEDLARQMDRLEGRLNLILAAIVGSLVVDVLKAIAR